MTIKKLTFVDFETAIGIAEDVRDNKWYIANGKCTGKVWVEEKDGWCGTREYEVRYEVMD